MTPLINVKYFKLLIFAFILYLFPSTILAVSDLPVNALSYPVLVVLEDKSSSSGFYIVDNSNVYFVTARHSIFNKNNTLKSKTIILSSCCNTDISKKIEFKINLEELLKAKLIQYHTIHDVAIVYMGKNILLNNGNTALSFSENFIQRLSDECNICLSDTKWIEKFDDVKIGNEVFIFGYPNSLGLVSEQQIDYNMPLLRKGIVAGMNVHKKTIVLDCPAYQGNSGGPVLIVEKLDNSKTTFLPIGIVTQFVPFVEKWVNDKYENVTNTTISNSGYSIVEPIDIVLELLFK